MDGTCESCGDEAELETVRRVYVTPASWDTEAAVQDAELERWCATCVAHYPHRAA